MLCSNSLSTTALYSILNGEEQPDSGEFTFGQTITTAHLPNENEEFFKDKLNLIDWLRQFSANKDEVYLRGFLGKMLFSGEETFKMADVLSGGEKVRCMISRMMLKGGNVLMLDEPTNHLDLDAVMWLEDYLIKTKNTVVVVSHAREFLNTVCTDIIHFFDSKLTYYKGNYD